MTDDNSTPTDNDRYLALIEALAIQLAPQNKGRDTWGSFYNDDAKRFYRQKAVLLTASIRTQAYCEGLKAGGYMERREMELRPSTTPEERRMTDEDIEALAIRAAKGNNGGEWATHYTEKQKAYWRQWVRDIARDAVATERERIAAFQRRRHGQSLR